jgi:hypothetical protein
MKYPARRHRVVETHVIFLPVKPFVKNPAGKMGNAIFVNLFDMSAPRSYNTPLVPPDTAPTIAHRPSSPG